MTNVPIDKIIRNDTTFVHQWLFSPVQTPSDTIGIRRLLELQTGAFK